jgi:hypothetical protein
MAARPLQCQGPFPGEAEIVRRLSKDARAWAAKATTFERDGFLWTDGFNRNSGRR